MPVGSSPLVVVTGDVRGTVVDLLVTGRPLAGAEVWVEGTGTSVLTDGEGRFRLERLPAGPQRLAVFHPALEALRLAAPMAGARVVIVGADRESETAADGRFAIRDVAPGPRLLEARAIGLRPSRLALSVAADATAHVGLSLVDTVVTLAATTVRGTASPAPLAEFEARRRAGGGWYVTADDIARRRPPNVLRMLEGAPGLQVINGSSAPFAGALLVSQRALGQVGKMASACVPQLLLDGVPLADARVTMQGDAMPLDSGLRSEDVYGIEVHTGLGTIPPKYRALDSGCGVMLVWTKRGGGG